MAEASVQALPALDAAFAQFPDGLLEFAEPDRASREAGAPVRFGQRIESVVVARRVSDKTISPLAPTRSQVLKVKVLIWVTPSGFFFYEVVIIRSEIVLSGVGRTDSRTACTEEDPPTCCL